MQIKSLTIIAILFLVAGCNEQRTQSQESSPTTSSQESLMRFPKTTIHAEFQGKYKVKHSCYVKDTGTKHEGNIVDHRGVALSLHSKGQESVALWWEFIGQSTWVKGDVYLLKFTDPKDPEKNWIKTIVYTGTPIQVIDSADVQVSINESK